MGSCGLSGRTAMTAWDGGAKVAEIDGTTEQEHCL